LHHPYRGRLQWIGVAMTKDEALKMCLEYIETDAHERKYVRHAIKKALAQPEPVAYAGNGTAGFLEGKQPTGFFIQADKRQPEPWEKFCDSNCVWTDHHPDCKLAQSEQEPVAFSCLRCVTPKKCAIHGCSPNTWPSEAPPQRKPLTDEEIYKASTEARMQEHYMGFHSGFIRFARAIEAALRSKNT
jgi:hypothetical protein